MALGGVQGGETVHSSRVGTSHPGPRFGGFGLVQWLDVRIWPTKIWRLLARDFSRVESVSSILLQETS